MGRKKKYKTKKEQTEAQRRLNMEYYERNKDNMKKKALDRYHGRTKGSKNKDL